MADSSRQRRRDSCPHARQEIEPWESGAIPILTISLLVIVGFTDAAASTGTPHPRTEIGTRCSKQEFQNNWQVTWPDVYDRCRIQ